MAGSSPVSLLQSCNPVVLQTCDAREAGPSDAIDGVLPGAVVTPASAAALAGLLQWASGERLSVVLRGGGSKINWGQPPARVDLVVRTRGLNRLIDHAHGDLTATAEAGMTLRDLNQQLARHRQWLAVESPFDATTIGGLVATNESGSLRQRHGTPRDLLIGVHLAMTDGRVVKAGGTVVKNVAGYDLGKLVSGSHGTLAAIVSATFKLAPLPGATATLTASFRDPAAAGRAAAAISASQLEPARLDVRAVAGADAAKSQASPIELLVQFASTEAAIEAQLDALRPLMGGGDTRVVTGDQEVETWRRQADAIWAAPGTVVRAAWLPAKLPEVLAAVGALGAQGARSVELVGRAGVGAGLLRLDADADASVKAVEQLRARNGILDHVVVLRADAAVKARTDAWGAPGGDAPIRAAIKRAFDPAGILNAGRGPV